MSRAIVIADDDFLVGKLDGTADVLISLGDLYDATIDKAYRHYKPDVTFAVRGNHDATGAFPDYVTPLHLKIITHGGIVFGGFEGCWRYKSKGAYLYDQAEVSDLLSNFPKVDVFVAHNSPKGFHERDRDVHQGFDAFRAYIERAQPRYFLHGHQHRERTTVIGHTKIIGVYGEMFLDI